ncbi:hypothetical protein CALCODRAFT_498749 [Calocera cornea HHB12733]|uniref:DCUN1 domain-containing protein n=1 Tax=Calocera cornea HHB12733 TaxID=1353952 RepID=A0A165ERE8_9BASI|nr:hypothetical protein CALCODRAFT_498749 [Calocera cornea HHB12733]
MIGIDGTIKLCQDLDVSPEDVVLLAIAYECKCPGVGEFTREGWIAGLQSLKCAFLHCSYTRMMVLICDDAM